MFKRHRRNILAALGGLAAAAALSLAALYSYREFYQPAEHDYAAQRYQPARDATKAVPPPKGQPRAQQYDPHCEQPQNHNDADLCAQWANVRAVSETNRLTRVALRLGYVGFWIALLGGLFGIIGTVLLWLAFQETRAANRIARRDYARARLEARKALKHAQSVSEAELRPYVFVERIELTNLKRYGKLSGVSDDPVDAMREESKTGILQAQVVVHFRNFGKVPARNIKVYSKTYFARLHEGRFWGLYFRVTKLWVCAPSHERRVFFALYVSEDNRMDFDAGVTEYILRMRYTFEDDSGNTFQERAAFRLDGADLETFYLLDDPLIAEQRAKWAQFELKYGTKVEARPAKLPTPSKAVRRGRGRRSAKPKPASGNKPSRK